VVLCVMRGGMNDQSWSRGDEVAVARWIPVRRFAAGLQDPFVGDLQASFGAGDGQGKRTKRSSRTVAAFSPRRLDCGTAGAMEWRIMIAD
jgi:hypothetical protein